MKKMRIFSGLTALAMTALALGTTAFAAESVDVTIGKDTKAPGEEFSIKVDLASLPSTGLTSVDFAITYDADIVSISDVSFGSSVTAGKSAEGDYGDTLYSWKDTGSQIILIYGTGLTDNSNWVKDGTFATISGKVSKNAKKGDVCNLKGVAVDRLAVPKGSANDAIIFSAVGDSKTTDYVASFTNGSITVDDGSGDEDIDWGNANCSTESSLEERVTIADAVLMARVAAEDTSASITAQGKKNGDVSKTGDGIHMDDVTLLLKYLAGLVKYNQLGNQ